MISFLSDVISLDRFASFALVQAVIQLGVESGNMLHAGTSTARGLLSRSSEEVSESLARGRFPLRKEKEAGFRV